MSLTSRKFAWLHAGIVEGRKAGLQMMFVSRSQRNNSQVEEVLRRGQTQGYYITNMENKELEFLVKNLIHLMLLYFGCVVYGNWATLY
jgi:hypothetical protein